MSQEIFPRYLPHKQSLAPYMNVANKGYYLSELGKSIPVDDDDDEADMYLLLNLCRAVCQALN